ncbi:glycerate kinase [Paenibacillus mucilaginosus]|uniref:Glycerate kinase n=2 Tax=Paenibacillus mucilaginosus TaxID=61624 RepID=H6NEZ7_9BACL|nr:glycerate kinase [Paenibacillus mucilaginosus]AEI40380.1 Glycerate kinase [Paenibacillus mucilaginosus KNP414]AFC29004.1 glycerate kinase [Paenibacillus mucilaginosus 3016]MCG7213268.1 glycerate kinase [Paenibacillus mucilaginosus]WDM29573.1 glycerate kinase [Paenibacillus mucilaginosus]WFA17750.1 glycerate kinase [Paenibacillus mucilaginosus]
MKFLIASDSFKGSLTSLQVGNIMSQAIMEEIPDAHVRILPMADGGEGTVDAVISAGRADPIRVPVTGPDGTQTISYYGKLHGHWPHPAAVVEIANICGLTMVDEGQRDPLIVSSRGLGDMLKALLDQGIRHAVIGLGGSACNDGGMGMLAALGVQFYDERGQKLYGCGADLLSVASVNWSQLDSRIMECELIIASDVTNPLAGPSGATYIFGPQKGLLPEMMEPLDQAMARYGRLLEVGNGRNSNHSLLLSPGSGAAGGLGFALQSIGGRVVPGAEIIADLTGLKSAIRESDWVLTGEGRSDYQTLYGKLPSYVSTLAAESGKPVVLISGSHGEGIESLYSHFTGCFASVNKPATLDHCLQEAENLLLQCTRNVVRLIQSSRKIG